MKIWHHQKIVEPACGWSSQRNS